MSGSVDSLDKLDGEAWSGSGMSLLTAPEWSCDQVAQWLHRVGLGKFSDGAKEKGFTGKQLMELDSGKIKVSRVTLPVVLITDCLWCIQSLSVPVPQPSIGPLLRLSGGLPHITRFESGREWEGGRRA